MTSDEEPRQPEPTPGGFSRRSLLTGAGVTAASAAALSRMTGNSPAAAIRAMRRMAASIQDGPSAPAASESFRVNAVRPADHLNLTFVFYNLQLQTSGVPNAQLVRITTGEPAYVVVEFPPQHIGEQVIHDPPGNTIDPPLGALVASKSRLVFKVPDSKNVLPYNLQSLLRWSAQSLELQLALSARAAASANFVPVAPPGALQTWLELPTGLVISPLPTAAFTHALAPVTHSQRTELWHTRLGTAAPVPTDPPIEPPAALAKIRAVWSVPYATSGPLPADAVEMPLLPEDRRDLVRQMSDRSLHSGTDRAKPADVALLALSSLGGWLQTSGIWEPDVQVSLTEWRHRSAMGRDSFVRTVRAGYLAPFGHRANKVDITERQFRASPSGDIVAYLIKKTYVVVKKPVKTFGPGTLGEPNAGRAFPYTRVELKTVTTPPIDDPGTNTIFFPTANGQYVPFQLDATDREGQVSSFTTPLVWVDYTEAFNPSSIDGFLIPAYNGIDINHETRARPLGGQKVAMADTAGAVSGSTTFPVNTYFNAMEGPSPDPGQAALVAADQPRFYPTMAQAGVALPAVQAVANGPVTPPLINFDPVYLANGLGGAANRPEVFARLLSGVPFSVPPDKGGGLATPSMAITGLSRALGPLGGNVANLTGGTFDPADFFSGASLPKLLGSISLIDLLPVFAITGAAALEKIPGVTTEVIYPNGDRTQIPTAIRTVLDWTTPMKNDPKNFLVVRTSGQPGFPTTLHLHAELYMPLKDPSAAVSNINGEVKAFEVHLFGDDPDLQFIVIDFARLAFSAKTGGKPDVDVSIADVRFVGELAFVNKLEEFLKSGGGSGLSIDIKPTGVTAGYTLAIPTVGLGVFTFQNLAFSGSLTLPFTDGKMRVRFAFCSREHPFIVTVSLFGGGGFFALALGLDGLEIIEASIEFGAACSLNLGVASGSVHVMAGIYFKLEHRAGPPPDDKVTLEGFLRAGGELEVLGIITISIEFYLGFRFESPDSIYGKASVTVKVEILFFSASVTLEVERRFAGGGDPTFGDLMTKPAWNTYCDAFA